MTNEAAGGAGGAVAGGVIGAAVGGPVGAAIGAGIGAAGGAGAADAAEGDRPNVGLEADNDYNDSMRNRSQDEGSTSSY
jgi:hypothetical protein